jgi:hypothetical protein
MMNEIKICSILKKHKWNKLEINQQNTINKYICSLLFRRK